MTIYISHVSTVPCMLFHMEFCIFLNADVDSHNS
jgi:hypothetical protein